VRPLAGTERNRLEARPRSTVDLVWRCRVLLASARREWVPWIATTPGCSDQTVRNVIREFERDGLDACLMWESSRSHTLHAKLDAVAAE
jgi:hypothetical protein